MLYPLYAYMAFFNLTKIFFYYLCIMKNLYLLLLTISLYTNTYSQITIQNTHVPRIGDTFVFAVDTSLYIPKPISGGIFDFSNLKLNDTTHFYYIKNDSTAKFPNSNLKLKIDTAEQTATYFNRTTNDLMVIALSNLSTIPLPIPSIPKLQGTLKYLSFPLSATTNLTTTDKIDITIPASFIPPQLNIDSLLSNNPSLPKGTTVVLDSFVLSINISLNLKTDGQGKIKTPVDNNIDVIKLIRKITITPKILMNGSATFGGFTVPLKNQDVSALLLGILPFQIPDITTHTYYSPAFRQEIINAAVDSMGRYQSVNYRYRTKNGASSASLTQVNITEIDVQFSNSRLTVNALPTYSPYRLTVYDLSGRKQTEADINHLQNAIDWKPISQPFIIQVTGENLNWTKIFSIRYE
jgi:hypothetical protein